MTEFSAHGGEIMPERKYNHYIPKFYLANFSGNKNFIDKCLLASGKVIRSAPTKSTGGKDYLYGKDGTIEETFMQLEGRWDGIVKKIIATESLPGNAEDLEYLLHFILLSENRTLVKANNNMAFWGEQYRVTAKLMRENGRLDVPEEAIEMIGAESPIPNLQDFKNHMFLMNICADLRMALIKNISSLPFITSDHPVVKYNQLFMSHGYYKAYGYGQMGIQIFFPFSPSLCLVLFDPIPYRLHCYYENKFVVKDTTAIRSINTLVAGYANQELYFSPTTSDRTIRKILDRRIPDGLSPASGSHRVGNGFFVFMSDPSYLHKVDIPLFSVIKPFREMKLSHFFSPPLRPHAEKVKENDKDYRDTENAPQKEILEEMQGCDARI